MVGGRHPKAVAAALQQHTREEQELLLTSLSVCRGGSGSVLRSVSTRGGWGVRSTFSKAGKTLDRIEQGRGEERDSESKGSAGQGRGIKRRSRFQGGWPGTCLLQNNGCGG